MEIWKDVVWYKKYYKISNLWNIKSFKQNKEWKLQKYAIDKRWYKYVTLYKNHIWKKLKIHRLALLSFVWYKWKHYQTNHINWDKWDNNINNLERCTASENIKHSYKKLNRISPVKWKYLWKHHNARKVYQFTKSWVFLKTWSCAKEARNILWIHDSHIWKCCMWKEKYKSAWWYKRSYYP